MLQISGCPCLGFKCAASNYFSSAWNNNELVSTTRPTTYICFVVTGRYNTNCRNQQTSNRVWIHKFSIAKRVFWRPLWATSETLIPQWEIIYFEKHDVTTNRLATAHQSRQSYASQQFSTNRRKRPMKCKLRTQINRYFAGDRAQYSRFLIRRLWTSRYLACYQFFCMSSGRKITVSHSFNRLLGLVEIQSTPDLKSGNGSYGSLIKTKMSLTKPLVL